MPASAPGFNSRTRLFSARNVSLIRKLSVVAGATAFALTLVYIVIAAISISTTTPYAQNFDSMGIPATATTPSTLPTDFKADALTSVRTVGTFAAAGTTTARAGGANLSSSAANGIYNFGSGTATLGGSDRSVGFLASGAATMSGNLYAQLVNNTGGNLSGLQISYNVEKYRNGSNAAGFRTQMFYSTDGSTWTSAGNNFLTSFPADANNNGFATAPGATVAVSSQTLSVSIPNGSNFYLAWNYSVTSGSTTTNAQALAVDDISILGISGGGSTNPSATGSASPDPVVAGNQSLLTVTVTPGTNPQSTGLIVTGNLTSIGGSATQSFFDDATNGDVTAGDNIFSYQATVPSNTSGGTKTLPISVADAQGRTASTSISLTVQAPTNPSVTGAANPSTVTQGGSTLLTGTVTPGTIPTSTGLAVTGDLSSIGGSSTHTFYDDGTHGDAVAGNNVFSFQATVDVGTSIGSKTIPLTVTDAQSRSGSGNISLNVVQQPVAPGTIVISQLYGGGGNSGATYTNDFIEIFNRSTTTVNLAGWSVQYTSAGATGGWSRTPLSGTLAPGQYYLVQEAQGAGGTTSLPTPDATGSINMSATNGHVALLSSNTTLPTGCPGGNPQLMDLVGYGTAVCFEGAGAAPGLDNVTADLRTHNGCKDTDSNGGNFTAGSPTPRNTSSPTNSCPAGDFPPEIFGASPSANQAHVPQDANITINFDEPVNVSGAWYQISCGNSGIHTATMSGGPVSFTLNPDSDFGFNDPCTVTIFASQVTDQDSDDPPDNMAADYVFSFNSEFFRDPAEHMVMGNPSNATTDTSNSTNFLMMKIQYALSYNDSRGAPNWTSWHLDSSWRGSAPRQDDFRADTSLPPGYHQVQGTDFSGSGFDRGHMCPSADRTSTIPDNSATFLMTNMVAQAPDNNQGPWAAFENYLRTFLPGNEIYIISGGTGVGGIGSNGPANTIAGGFVTVPAKTWKVALILPVGDNDVSRVDANTRTIAVIMPNTQGIRSDQWQKYLATVDQAEALSGYDFYSNVPTSIQDVFEAKLDAANDTAPVASDQSASTTEDNSRTITLAASDFNVNNMLTFTVATGPAHGTLGSVAPASCSNGNCTTTVTYTPAADYNGPDSFTFNVNDGALDSTSPATVTINVTEVNDDPVAVNDSKQTAEDSSLNFPSSDLTSNDSPGPNESGQTLTVDSIISTPNTHGSIVLSSGEITYTPEANYNGPASFDYHVCDNGTTDGSPDSKCATGTVNITVTEVNDDPSATNDSKNTSEDTSLDFPSSDLTANDSTGPENESGQTLTVTSVTATASTHGSVSLTNGTVSYAPAANYNGSASFDYRVCDNGTTNRASDSKCATGTVNVTINAVNDAPVAANDNYSTNEDTVLNGASVLVNDSDVENDPLTAELVSGTSHGALTLNANGTFSYMPAANYYGPDSFTYRAKDSSNATSNVATVSLVINPVNDAPLANNDACSTDWNTPLNVPAPGVLANDTDIDSGALSAQLVSNVSHGVLALNSNGGFSYTPSLNFSGTDSFTYRAFDGMDNSNVATVTITVNCPQVTALGPAQLWIGLKNSDDVGTKFDLLAEFLKNGSVIGTGQLNDVPGGSSGFNNAVQRTINMSVANSQSICPGDTLSFRLSVRVAASSGHVSGTARLWFNDSAANSRFATTLNGVTGTYYLQSGFGLAITPGPGPKSTIDVLVNRNQGGNPFKPFGTWTTTF